MFNRILCWPMCGRACAVRLVAVAVLVGPSSVPSHDSGALIAETTAGIEGLYRVGRWTAVRADAGLDVVSIETRDGDGVQTEYSREGDRELGEWSYVVPGSEAAPFVLKDAQRNQQFSGRFPTRGSPSREPAMIPLEMPWVVVIGDSLGVDTIGANRLLGRQSTIAVSHPTQADGFPDSMLGYDGVDMIVLTGSGAGLLKGLRDVQQQAIEDWITGGGFLLVSLGESASTVLEASSWLMDLLPVEIGSTVRFDPSAIETYTSSQTPLEPFVGARLPRDQGRVVIMGRTMRRITTPIAAEYVVGFGRILVVAADLDNEMFAKWPERLDLVTSLAGNVLNTNEVPSARMSHSTAYQDLAGQLRATLDQFSLHRKVGFSVISLILLILIAAIGPLDYLLVNRLLGRPLLGWFSFPLVAISLSALLAYQSRLTSNAVEVSSSPFSSSSVSTADRDVACNRIEIFDIDSIAKVGRGFSANYVYSHRAKSFDVTVVATDSLKRISRQIRTMLTAPLGNPGESFGGIQLAIEDSRLPLFRIVSKSSGPMRTNTIKGMPIASRSSKGLSIRCRFELPVDDVVPLKRRQGSELLQGALVNPLPFDLLDGVLVYRNWAYLLPTRLPKGSRVESMAALRQKNFRWRLSGKKLLEEANTQIEEWDPAMTDSLDRVAEMLMFHRVVGGRRYTSLHNQPFGILDLSHALTEDRCMLLGRVEESFTTIRLSSGASDQSPKGESLTLVRYLLPVENENR